MSRYPVEPALELSGMSAIGLSRHAGLHPSAVQKARSRGGFTEAMADRVATSIGHLPWSIWPQWLDDVIADCEVECADDRCSERFVPKRAGHRFCSPRCQRRRTDREWRRAKYQIDPAYRAKKLAEVRERRADPRYRKYEKGWQRRYYAENAEQIRERERLRHQANPERKRARGRARYQAKRDELLLKQRIRDHYRRNHDTRPQGCPEGCPLHPANQQVAA